jgi:hypothetical protein
MRDNSMTGAVNSHLAHSFTYLDFGSNKAYKKVMGLTRPGNFGWA